MSKRPRSPDYPSLSLKEAVERARLLHEAIGQHPTSREVVAKSMGYRGLSGASATAISSLNKYGLLEGRGDDIRVSDLAMAVLHPHSDAERNKALREAALGPDLFRELADRFRGSSLNDELLKNYLLRNGFTGQGVSSVLHAYKETIEFVRGALGDYDSGSGIEGDPEPMHQLEGPQSSHTAARAPAAAPSANPAPPKGAEYEVKIGELGFKGVGFVRIMASPGLSERKALAMAKQIISMMSMELEEQERARVADDPAEENEDEQNA